MWMSSRSSLSKWGTHQLLVIDLILQVKFKYEFYLEATGSYGSFKNGQWTGMIKELRNQKADMAVIDMSITSIRQTAVDFTMPFMNTGVLILLLSPARCGHLVQESQAGSTKPLLLPAASLPRRVDLHDHRLSRGLHHHVPPGQVSSVL